MITEKELQSLVEFVSDDPLVVSLYVNVDPTQTIKEEIRLHLRGLLKQASEVASSKDIQAIERFFEMEYDWSARGLIIFTCQARGLWKVIQLAVPVENRIVAARRPYVTPLQDALNAYARYGVLLADKEGARLFLFNLGELQDAQGILGEEVKKQRQGGLSAPKFQRHIAEHASANLRDVVELTRTFCGENRCERLILGGNVANVAAIRGMLPKNLQDKIVGEVPMDMLAGEVEVRDKTLEVIRKHLRDEEDELVQRAITAAAKGDAGVIGLADTLDALQQGKVYILLVSEEYEAAGARCTHCGFLASEMLPKCAYCGSAMRPNAHVVDAAVRQSIERGVIVRVVVGNEALRTAGGIAAILRY